MVFDARSYWERRLAKNYSLGGVGWLGLGEPFNRWMYRVRRQQFLRYARLVTGNQPLDVLDVGSGTGFYIQCWQELGARSITGSDLTDVAVSQLIERFPSHDFVRLDIGGDVGQVAGSNFDAISIMDVLFHIVDDASYQRAFSNLARLLKPGGHLLFTENFLHQGTERGEHQVQRTLQEIERMIGDVGLTPVLRRPQFVLMNMPIDSNSTLHRRFWNLLTKIVARNSAIGNLLGGLLYLPELILTRCLREGPSTELMICRKT